MDNERIKKGSYLTGKYFEEQWARIREIRASERKLYQKITDLYATDINYDKNVKSTNHSYATGTTNKEVNKNKYDLWNQYH